MEESPLGSGYEPPRPGYKMTGRNVISAPEVPSVFVVDSDAGTSRMSTSND